MTATMLLALFSFRPAWANDTLAITDPAFLRKLASLTKPGDELVFGGDFEKGLLTWETSGSDVALESADLEGLNGSGTAVLLWREANSTCWLRQTLPTCRAGTLCLLTFDAATVLLGDVGTWQVVVKAQDGADVRSVWSGEDGHAWRRRGILFLVPADESVTIYFMTDERFMLDNVSVRPLPGDWRSALAGSGGAWQEAQWDACAAQMARAIREGPDRLEVEAKKITARAGGDFDRFRVLDSDLATLEWRAIPENDTDAIRRYVTQRLDAHWAALAPYLRRWHPDLSESRLRIVFLNYLVHASTLFAQGAPADGLKAQLTATEGDCTVLARRLQRLAGLWTGEEPRLVTVAAWALGHALVAGDGYLADPTHNIVWFADALEMNEMPMPLLRYMMHTQAHMGVAKQLLPASSEPNHAKMSGYRGDPEAYRHEYSAYLKGLANIDRFYVPDVILATVPKPVPGREASARTRKPPLKSDWLSPSRPRSDPGLVNVLATGLGARVIDSSPFFPPPNDPTVLLRYQLGSYAAAADSVLPQWIEFDLGNPREVEAAAITWWSQADRGVDFRLLGRRRASEAWSLLAEVKDNDSVTWRAAFATRQVAQVRLEVTKAAGQGRTLIDLFALFAPSPDD